MMKIVLFLCSIVIFQLSQDVAIAAPEQGQTQSSASPKTVDGAMLSKDPEITNAEFNQVKIDYYGKAANKICAAQQDEKCREGGACCTGGPRCKLILKKLRDNTSIFTRRFIKNFCE